MAARQRKARPPPQTSPGPSTSSSPNAATATAAAAADMPASVVEVLRRQPLWIILAVSSGACAALNGVFAKLTTTTLTSTLSSHISTLLGLSPSNTIVDVATRGVFFSLNLAFNALMWALFTAALTRGDSTTRVSVVNVSSNFVLTAVLGWMIFGEKLPMLWWVGASLLAAGNVVIGRREEGQKPGGSVGLDESRGEAEELLRRSEDQQQQQDEDLLELDADVEDNRRLKKGELADAPL